jgi:hypothetical protein
MSEITRLEKIANNFIETYLRDNPVMIFSLDTELESYTEDIEELNDEKSRTEILREYLKNKTNDEEINSELINAADKALNPSYNNNYEEEMPDDNLLYYMQNIEDHIIYELAQLVLRSDKVRIRTMHELEEAQQDDPIMPNKWIYHKNSDLNEVLNYIRNVYDEFRIEDEIDEHHNLS